MHKPIVVAALLAASCAAQAASDADLAVIRAQIDDMKKTYEQRISSLEKKLAEAEAQAARQPAQAAGSAPGAAAAPAPVATADAAGAGSTSPPAGRIASAANAFNPEVSLILQGQYTDRKNIPNRSISGFWPATGHDHDHGGGGADNTRGFSIDHTELIISAGIDPYFNGRAIFAIVDDEVETEEAWFQSSAIGYGLGVKGGRFRSGIGYLNEQHPHQWDFYDAPLMYQALFGTAREASYTQDGVQMKWLAPTPVFLEFGAEVGRSARFPGTDRNKNGNAGGALFGHVGGDVGASNSWRAGLSWLKISPQDRETDLNDVNDVHAPSSFSGNSDTYIADFVWKWAPNGNPSHNNFKVQGEYFWRKEKGDLTCAAESGEANACSPDPNDPTSVTSNYMTRQSGWYAQTVYQFTPNWRAGLRYDQLDSGTQDLGANEANLNVVNYKPKRASIMVDYSWSEFSRMRLQYAQDKSIQGLTDDQITLQYIMSLGPHGAHKF
jgi:hypothetical protein